MLRYVCDSPKGAYFGERSKASFTYGSNIKAVRYNSFGEM